MPDPRVRRRARERAVQLLFGLDFTGYAVNDALEPFWVMNPSRPPAKRYAEKLARRIAEHLDAIDAAIAGAVEHWRPERVGALERAVLRVAVCEMLFMADVPPKVAINEAVEIAKRYGGDEAPRFVNGVLDRLKDAAPPPAPAPEPRD